MAVTFELPEPWASRGWRLKIRDKERVEPPHVTLMFRTRSWRFGLRSAAFLDREPDPAEVPRGFVTCLTANLDRYIQGWDSMYPEHPVRSQEPDSE